jgi:UDP-N-acetylmuramyl pentapeptide phosphotransferase/UDP-N-acetylglucosamine-1-phosphate transferase
VSLGVVALLAVLTGLAAWGATALALRFLHERAILDHPNQRSSHQRPTPRGGGIAVVPVVLLAWIVFGVAFSANSLHWIVVAAAAFLAIVSWLDDIYDLSAAPRFASHIVAVAIVLALLPANRLVFQGVLPLALDRLAAGLLWVWFVNLYNFMDGIDGITGVETASIGAGLAAVALLGGGLAAAGMPLAPLGLALAAAALGFLRWNWHPAQIFLGDVGSVPLGFLTGWLLIAAAADGAWAAALILPAYYLADATTTLARRAARLEPVWRAHREHAYQQAVAAGQSHGAVSAAIGSLNLALIALAVAAGYAPAVAVGMAVVATALFLIRLSRATIAPGGGR